MTQSRCWYCNQHAHFADDDGIEDSQGIRYCPGSSDGLHHIQSGYNHALENATWRTADADPTQYSPRRRKKNPRSSDPLANILIDIDRQPPVPTGLVDEHGNIIEEIHEAKAIWATKSYCAGCRNEFDTATGSPRTIDGVTLTFCPYCGDDGTKLGENGGNVITAGAPALDLVCDHCGDEDDTDDDTDFFYGPGDVCTSCGHGKLVFAASPDDYEGAGLLQADDQSAIMNESQSELTNLVELPRSYKAPRSMTRTQVDQLNKNNDGGGMSSMSSKTASYNDLRNHLVNYHRFRNDWLQGYNEIDLLHVHDQDHKSGAYAVDHEHPIEDIVHGTMITSSKLAGEIIYPDVPQWDQNKNELPYDYENEVSTVDPHIRTDTENRLGEFPMSVTMINNENNRDWRSLSNPTLVSTVIPHNPGQYDSSSWHEVEGSSPPLHKRYEAFLGTWSSPTDHPQLDLVARISPTKNVSGGYCHDCNREHGWKWTLSKPNQSKGLDVLLHDGRPVTGTASSLEKAAILAHQFHQNNYIDILSQ